MNKVKLTIDEQIMHMKNNGILFNIVNEEQAKEFLMKNNYYFKLKAYAKNYEKYLKGENKGKYVNLEFAYLMELSRLDMYFRKLILKMSLDLEHFLKTQLLSDVSSNEQEDGYEIVRDLFKKYPFIEESIKNKRRNVSVCNDLINKYDGNFAVWNLVEILSFGDFIKLYELYYKKYPNKNSAQKHLWSVKMLRNAAAHNNCLLNSLRKPYNIKFKPNLQVNHFISSIKEINYTQRTKKMNNPVIHDFVVLLYVFNNSVVSKDIIKHTMKELKNLIDKRAVKNKNYFEKDEVIKSTYSFVKKIVDYFYDIVYNSY